MSVNINQQYRKYQPKYCLHCGKEIPIGNLRVGDYNKRKFCNSSCAASYNNKHKEKKYKYCLNCGSEIPLENKYCSNKCQHEYEQREWEEKWLSGEIGGNVNPVWTDTSKRVKVYLFKKYDNKCARCRWGEINPYTGKVPLEVEHLDGNPYNTTPENVTLLCPNCHSLTKTYKGANKGNGRGRTWTPKPIELDT